MMPRKNRVLISFHKMKPKGIFIYVDDDREDHELFKMALKEICDNTVLSAYDGEEAYKLIQKHKDDLFLIICDMNMPKVNGLELKHLIENTPDLKLKAIPFIFHTSVTDSLIVKEAYSLNIQGYMEKKSDYNQTVALLRHFITFWSNTMHPTYFMPEVQLK
jgi:CheY-like chemotaxis protein